MNKTNTNSWNISHKAAKKHSLSSIMINDWHTNILDKILRWGGNETKQKRLGQINITCIEVYFSSIFFYLAENVYEFIDMYSISFFSPVFFNSIRIQSCCSFNNNFVVVVFLSPLIITIVVVVVYQNDG